MECASVRQCFNTSTFNSMQMYFYFRKTPHPLVSDFLTCRKQERVQQWFFSFKTFTVYQHRCSKDGMEIAKTINDCGYSGICVIKLQRSVFYLCGPSSLDGLTSLNRNSIRIVAAARHLSVLSNPVTHFPEWKQKTNCDVPSFWSFH